ncbi:hypothetical protein AQUSIP_25570 [Aquicella siphonis]|uniref:ChrR-like cupin domain-containing protein n=1 Tax=Aquicella siphonis TaxID=254247 RepID=A0A5E4PJL7_9COXI|nr:cupin domain-containing protein [Aquicella siphonis]VVC77230.1 hypothetical protein AQUSIP_25570 [Aquicella siphonis]
MRSKFLPVTASILLAAFTCAAHSEELRPITSDSGTLVWNNLPSLPGTQVAILAGDPQKKGFFIARLKFPANFKIAPHYHDISEHDMVISGTYHLGTGNKFDLNKTIPMTAGTYITIPAKTQHYGWTQDETILQISGVGPWGAIYNDTAAAQSQSNQTRIHS